MTNTQTETVSDQIREQYQEVTTDSGVIAVITDPQNDQAWIKSTLTYTIQP